MTDDDTQPGERMPDLTDPTSGRSRSEPPPPQLAAGPRRARTSTVIRSTSPGRVSPPSTPPDSTADGKPDRRSRFYRWLLKGHPSEPIGYYERRETTHQTHSWYKVMCLTGVDYFSTLGYQPGIAALAAGALSPFATLVLVLITLFGALPMYRRVAAESPHGDGSISMLENLLPTWQGKLLVLALIGFVATGFVITITLSAADATAHLAENPFTRFVHGYEVLVTLLLIALLGAVFLKGFGEAIGLAVGLVVVYLLLNVIVVGVGLWQIVLQPRTVSDWVTALFSTYGNPLMMIVAALAVFPRLALGLSGFETGVVVMPLVKGDPTDTEEQPAGRIRSAQKLLAVAAIIMSVMLIGSSVVTTLLIPPEAFQQGGAAYGRALAYVAHEQLGSVFGTVYDVSTILILWFAGASALAGLLNIVPRYLPRYGMAPDWARATRPLVLIFIAVCFLVTIVFRADVEAQAGAYATGVLALITSATIAVTLSAHRKGQRGAMLAFGVISLIFIYTTVVTIFGRPEGLQIAALFILAIVVASVVSRLWRQTELRVNRVVLDEDAVSFIRSAKGATLHIIAHDTDVQTVEEYDSKEAEQRSISGIPPEASVLFLEVNVCDPSEFAPDLNVKGVQVGGHRVLRAESSAVPNAIAALLLHLRDTTGTIPHAYFQWTEGHPLTHLPRYVLLGEGDIAPVAHEVLRRADPDPKRRPVIHVA